MKQKLGELLGDAIVYMREAFRFKSFYVRKIVLPKASLVFFKIGENLKIGKTPKFVKSLDNLYGFPNYYYFKPVVSLKSCLVLFLLTFLGPCYAQILSLSLQDWFWFCFMNISS